MAQVGAVAAVGLGWLTRQLAYYRLETSSEVATIAAVCVGAVLAVLICFPAGRAGRKLGLLEDVVAAVVTFGLLSVVLVLIERSPDLGHAVLGTIGLGAALGYAAAACFGLLLFAFVGSSVGFLLRGSPERDPERERERAEGLAREAERELSRGALHSPVARFIGELWRFVVGRRGDLDTRFRYEWFIARRHLMAKKRKSFISVITVISVLAVAVGVWCLTVVLSVMSGFETDLRSKILGTHAHAVVQKYATAFKEHEEVAEEVRRVRGVVGVSPFLLGQVMITSEGQVQGVVMKGIVPETVGDVTDLPEDVATGELSHLSSPELIRVLPRTIEEDAERESILTPRDRAIDRSVGERPEGAPVLPGIAIGRELARSLRVFVGDRVNVISPLSEEMGPTGPIPRSRSFQVAAIFYTGMYEYDSSFVYIHLSEAQRFFDMPGAVTGLEVRTTSLDEAHATARRIETSLEGYPYYARHWGEMHRNLFAALKLEKLVMAVILAFIVLVASFVILATLIMMVMEKGKDIAILKSMGARDSSIMKIFVVEGLVVAVVGTILGLVLGLGTCAFIASGIIKLNPEVYYIHTLPVLVEPLQLVLVCIVAVLLSYLATVYPSVTASRLHPVEGLRDE